MAEQIDGNPDRLGTQGAAKTILPLLRLTDEPKVHDTVAIQSQ